MRQKYDTEVIINNMKTTIIPHKKTLKRAYNCTEFELNAYIDNELSDKEKARVILATQQSRVTRTKLSDLQALKDLIRYSYTQ